MRVTLGDELTPAFGFPLSLKERGIEGVSFWVKFPGACPGNWGSRVLGTLGFIPFD